MSEAIEVLQAAMQRAIEIRPKVPRFDRSALIAALRNRSSGEKYLR